jgi:hypothetical protein
MRDYIGASVPNESSVSEAVARVLVTRTAFAKMRKDFWDKYAV